VRRGLLAVAVAATLAIGAAQAWATGSIIEATNDTAYDTPTPTLAAQGTLATFGNGDDVTHTVTADEEGPDGKPLFRTGNTPGMSVRNVDGTQFLSTGFYDFHCSLHPVMQGELEVGALGAPVERPEISLKVKSKKLEKVVKSGKLKVAVSAEEPTRAEGVSLTAKKGAKSIAKRASLNVNPGETQTVKLRLKKKAEEKLAELDKAKVKVTAEVDFGSPAKASKKLK
jgi:plastocyanin